MNAPKKEIREMKLAGKDFLLKARGSRKDSLYPSQGFARDLQLSCLLWKKGICPRTISLKDSMLQEKVRNARQLDFSRDVEDAARLLARLHSVKVGSRITEFLEKKDFVQRARAAKLSKPEKKKLAISHPALLAKLETLWKRMKGQKIEMREQCICHNDTVAQNFLVSGKRIYLIDFEWASHDCYESDIAGFLSPLGFAWSGQELSPAGEKKFIFAYSRARGLPVAEVTRKVEMAKPYVHFSHLAWIARILISHPKKRKLGSREKFELDYSRRSLKYLGRI